AICKPERQPGWLFTLSDEDFLIGIGQLVIRGSHCTASSRASGGLVARHRNHTASCKPIETGQRPLEGESQLRRNRIDRISAFPPTKGVTNEPDASFYDEFLACSCIAATLAERSTVNRGSEGCHRL
ncbi:MAG TPA: hypothetical protein VIJ35_05565, partial [Bradyrhizobium sp.]